MKTEVTSKQKVSRASVKFRPLNENSTPLFKMSPKGLGGRTIGSFHWALGLKAATGLTAADEDAIITVIGILKYERIRTTYVEHRDVQAE